MKIILKVNTNDNDRIEMWNSARNFIAIIHVDDLFPRRDETSLRDRLYGKEKIEYKLEEIEIDG